MIPIKIKAKLNAYTKINPFDNQFIDAPIDDNVYGRKNGVWVQVDDNSNQIFRSEIEEMLDKHVHEPDGETIIVKDNKLTAVALYDQEYDNLLAEDANSHILGNPITATDLRAMLADLLSRLNALKDRVDDADTEHKDHEVIWSNFDEINKIIGEITDLKITINQLDGSKVEFDPTSLVEAIKTLESVVYSNFDIINGNVGDINDLQQSLKNHNLDISNLSQAVKELTEVVYDNFDKINEAIGDISELQQVVDKPQIAPKDILDVLAEHNQRILNEHDEVNKLTAEVSDFKELYKTDIADLQAKDNELSAKDTELNQSIETLETSTNTAIQNLQAKDAELEAKDNELSDSITALTTAVNEKAPQTQVNEIETKLADFVTLADDQNISGVKTFVNGVAVNGTTADNKQLIIDLRPGQNVKIEQNVPGKKLGLAFDSENGSVSIYNVVGSSNENRIDIDNDGAKYNGKEIATTDEVREVLTGSEVVKVINIDDTTIGDNVSTILGYVNRENGGSLISFGFKVGTASIIGTSTKLTIDGSTITTTTGNSTALLKPGSYYWCYPEQIDLENSVTNVYFTCTNGFTLGSGVMCLGSDNTAKLAGQDFGVNGTTIIQNFFPYNNVANVPLEHLTIVYHA